MEQGDLDLGISPEACSPYYVLSTYSFHRMLPLERDCSDRPFQSTQKTES